MFKEDYLGNWRNFKDLEGHKEYLTRADNVNTSILTPEESLTQYWRASKRTKGIWITEFVPAYVDQLRKSLPSRQRISWLQWKEYIGRETDEPVWIIGFRGPESLGKTKYCPRFVLIDILEGRINL